MNLPYLRLPLYTAVEMKRLSLLVPLIAAAGVCHADLRSEITAANRQLEKAAMAKDVKGAEATMRATLTSDFKYVQAGKIQDAKTFINNYSLTIAMTEKITSHSTRILSLKESGSKGVATVEKKMTGTMKTPDKKLHSIDWTGTFTEEYRKVGGQWKTATMTAGHQKFLMDGKPIKM